MPFGDEGHCFSKQSCVRNIFQRGFGCYICWFGTAWVVSASTTWILNIPCRFLWRGSGGGEQAVLGQRTAALAAEALAAPCTCRTYNFAGKMRVSVFSSRVLIFFFFLWFGFWMLYFCSGSTVFPSCSGSSPFFIQWLQWTKLRKKPN